MFGAVVLTRIWSCRAEVGGQPYETRQGPGLGI